MSKNVPKSDSDAPNDVDMERIKELMGPLPYETSSKEAPKQKIKLKNSPKTAPPLSKTSEAVTEAVEEANATLKAAMPDFDKTVITPVGDEAMALVDVSSDKVGQNSPSTEPEDGAAEVVGEGIVADDPKVINAVDDIVASESDTVLEAEDKEREGDSVSDSKKKTSFKERLKSVWEKPAAKWAVVITFLLLLLAVAIVPYSRYFILNNVGVRASAGLTVIDTSTLQPLKNVTVSIGGVSAQTNSNGVVKLEHLKLGDSTLEISKRAYTSITKKLTIGWGSNPEGQFRLAASGAQYSFMITDYLSGKPIEKAEVASGEGNASSDKDGKIVLSLDTSGKADTAELEVQVTAANYRAETVKIKANTKDVTSAKLVTSHKDVYISNRSGKYDIYTIDIDGKNDKKIVNGTGIERADMGLAVQQNGDLAAYVATRENARNSDGYLLSTLYLVDTKSGTLAKIDQSEQIEIVGWGKEGRLVYVKIAAGASGANPKRYRLVTVNSKNTAEKSEIASANAFNDVVMAGDKVLYAPSNALKDNPNPGLFVVNADGTNSVAVTNKEVMNIFRTDYNTVTIFSEGKHYIYKIGAASSTLTAVAEPTSVNRLYIDNQAGNRSLWVDDRGGKGLLLAYDKATQKDVTLATQAGLKIPVYWLDENVALFRVNDGKQSSDYVVNVNGGEARKVQDVSDTAGISRWYYY